MNVLQLESMNQDYVWRNPFPQSKQMIRPILMTFEKETKELNLRTFNLLKNSIDKLQSFHMVCFESVKIEVEFDVEITALDGKAVSHITETGSNAVCNACGAKPTEMNNVLNLNNGKFSVKKLLGIQSGLTVLHNYMRFFDLFQHLGQRIHAPTFFFQARSDAQKEEVSSQKLRIQNELWVKLGLRVDVPKSGGSGNTNTGNTMRKVFESLEIYSEITGVNLELMKRVRTALCATVSQLPINITKFKEYNEETFRLYVKLYEKYPLPASCHKFLIHGWEIVQNFQLPILFYGEEGQEHCNKWYKHYRLLHARKNSRASTMEDVFMRCIDQSDPVIALQILKERSKSKKKKCLPSEVYELLDINEEDYVENAEEDCVPDDTELEFFMDYIDGLSDTELESLKEND